MTVIQGLLVRIHLFPSVLMQIVRFKEFSKADSKQV